MIRTRAALLLLLMVTIPLGAQGAIDYGVKIRAEGGFTRVPVQYRVVYDVSLTKPEGAPEVMVEIDVPGEDLQYGSNCTGAKPVRCTVPSNHTFVTVASTLSTPGTFTATARVLAANDPDPQNDQSAWTVEVVDAPALSVGILSGDRFEPGRETQVGFMVFNYGATAHDVTATFTLMDGPRFTGKYVPTDPSVTCTAAAVDRMVCTRSSVGHHETWHVAAEVIMPERFDGSEVSFAASVSSRVADFDPINDTATATAHLIRHLLVVNTNDEGAGSLRQALLDAQQLCETELCTIDFRIPGNPPGGRHVIQPRTELPEVRGLVKLDGGTQTEFGGNTYIDGPEIVIDGSLTEAPTRGLVLGGPSCEMYVLHLAIVNFPSPGIQAHRGLYDFKNCSRNLYPNTLIAWNELTGNYRGVAIVGDGYATIADNLIAHNRRTGVYTDRSTYVQILRNEIRDNGASGIFLNLDHVFLHQAAVVEENVITGNAEWGIARALTGDARIQRNRIYGNRFMGIDSGLDFATPNVAEDRHEGSGMPNKPVLIAAQYDPVANKTRVSGRLDSESVTALSGFTVDFYMSRSLSAFGLPEAELWVGALQFPRDGGHTDFVAELDGDLRGKFITATNTRMHLINFDDFVHDTSELSNAVQGH